MGWDGVVGEKWRELYFNNNFKKRERERKENGSETPKIKVNSEKALEKIS